MSRSTPVWNCGRPWRCRWLTRKTCSIRSTSIACSDRCAPGNEIHEALAATRVFPAGFVDAVQVGEDSGMLAETMANLSNQYQDEAKLAMNVITAVLGFLVFLLIAVIIIFFIYQIFMNAYLGPINEALEPF